MSLLRKLEKALVSWHNRSEWKKVEDTVIHEVAEEYGESCDVTVRTAQTYRHRDTGERRQRVGMKLGVGDSVTVFHSREYIESNMMSWESLARGSFASHPRKLWEREDA